MWVPCLLAKIVEILRIDKMRGYNINNNFTISIINSTRTRLLTRFLTRLLVLCALLVLLSPLLFLTSCATPSSTTKSSAKPALSLAITPKLTLPTSTKSALNAADSEALQKLVKLQERLDSVAGSLLINNADLCPNLSRNLIGITAKTKYSYSPQLTDAAQKNLYLNERLKVVNVLANSGAEQAGIRRGDILITAEDLLMPKGPNAENEVATMLAPLVANTRSSIKLTVVRGEAILHFTVPLTRGCGIRIQLGNTDLVNSYADGRRLMITRGMMNFVNSNEELAYVIAKEMAHNILAHPAKLRTTETITGIIDNLSQISPNTAELNNANGMTATPKELDIQADRLSLYLLVRAGYNVDQVRYFWQRLAKQYPATILNSHTALHPAIAHRLIGIEKAIAEIQEKQKNQQPLLP